MMDMKKEETLRLTEFIINEEETINEHEAVTIDYCLLDSN